MSVYKTLHWTVCFKNLKDYFLPAATKSWGSSEPRRRSRTARQPEAVRDQCEKGNGWRIRRPGSISSLHMMRMIVKMPLQSLLRFQPQLWNSTSFFFKLKPYPPWYLSWPCNVHESLRDWLADNIYVFISFFVLILVKTELCLYL